MEWAQKNRRREKKEINMYKTSNNPMNDCSVGFSFASDGRRWTQNRRPCQTCPDVQCLKSIEMDPRWGLAAPLNIFILFSFCSRRLAVRHRLISVFEHRRRLVSVSLNFDDTLQIHCLVFCAEYPRPCSQFDGELNGIATDILVTAPQMKYIRSKKRRILSHWEQPSHYVYGVNQFPIRSFSPVSFV